VDVGDDRPALRFLQLLESQAAEFKPPQPTARQQRQDGAVAYVVDAVARQVL